MPEGYMGNHLRKTLHYDPRGGQGQVLRGASFVNEIEVVLRRGVVGGRGKGLPRQRLVDMMEVHATVPPTDVCEGK
jgi:hypothetical protein